jgi:hypothetical protein
LTHKISLLNGSGEKICRNLAEDGQTGCQLWYSIVSDYNKNNILKIHNLQYISLYYLLKYEYGIKG